MDLRASKDKGQAPSRSHHPEKGASYCNIHRPYLRHVDSRTTSAGLRLVRRTSARLQLMQITLCDDHATIVDFHFVLLYVSSFLFLFFFFFLGGGCSSSSFSLEDFKFSGKDDCLKPKTVIMHTKRMCIKFS